MFLNKMFQRQKEDRGKLMIDCFGFKENGESEMAKIRINFLVVPQEIPKF